MAARADRESELAEYFTARAIWLRRLAYGLSGDWHTAEDLVQATFVRLYRGWGRIRVESLDAYARRTLVNVFLSHRRSRRRESVVEAVPDRPTHSLDAAQRLVLHQALARWRRGNARSSYCGISRICRWPRSPACSG